MENFDTTLSFNIMPTCGETHIFVRKNEEYYCLNFAEIVLSERSLTDVDTLAKNCKIVIGTIKQIEENQAWITIVKCIE